MAGVVPAINAFPLDADPRDKPGGDEEMSWLRPVAEANYRLLQVGTG